MFDMTPSRYAWRITKDHLAERFDYVGKRDEGYAVGKTGPSDAPDDLTARLDRGEGHTFRMYDDDGELYYTGKAVWVPELDRDDAPFDDWERVMVGPLIDYGRPAAGAVVIKWHGKPDWTCEA